MRAHWVCQPREAVLVGFRLHESYISALQEVFWQAFAPGYTHHFIHTMPPPITAGLESMPSYFDLIHVLWSMARGPKKHSSQISVSIKLIGIMVWVLLSIRCDIVALVGMCRGREIRHPQQRIHNSGSCCLLDRWSGWKRCWWLQILEVLNCRMWQSCRCQLLRLVLLLLLLWLKRFLIIPAPFFFQLCVQESDAPAGLLANLI